MKVTTAEFVVSAAGPGQYPKGNLPEIAFVGRSNVGKSSLLNSLTGRKKLAQTSGTPGKTRLINFFLINNSFYFVDLPGYGFARVAKAVKKQWGKIIEEYLIGRPALKLVVLLLDVRHMPSAGDLAMYQWLVHYNLPTVIVATKADKIPRSKCQKQLGQIRLGLGLGGEGPVILYSARTAQGKEELWSILKQYL